LLVVGLFVCFAFADISVVITLPVPTYNSGEHLIINWEIKNEGNDIESILTWGTPLEEVEWNYNIFSIVTDDNVPAEYQGRAVKRVPPTTSDFALLFPNDVKFGTMKLSKGYKFYESGVYNIKLMAVQHTNSGESKPLLSNSVTLTVIVPDDKIKFEVSGKNAVTYFGCTSSREATVNTATNNAITASSNALNYLNNNCRPTYEKWFGSYTASRYSTVDNHFTAIYSALSGKGFGIDCSTCTQPGVYAYVYPTDKTHRIYLCSVFWSSSGNPATYDSQPGTLTHEMSHFNDVAATGDYQYGTSGCLSLAISNPATAVQNADSHEYFQENYPSGC